MVRHKTLGIGEVMGKEVISGFTFPHAPEVVIPEEGRCLAEEMALSNYGPQEISVFKEGNCGT
jgi:hypothetical protein